MFSKSCEYGIRALTIIGHYNNENKKIGIKEICKIANTPESFTAKILQELVRRNILSSQKGPNGGFYFKRDLADITLFEIVTAIDGERIFNKCGLGFDNCNATNPCPLHAKYEDVKLGLIKMCKSSTLDKLSSQLALDNYQR